METILSFLIVFIFVIITMVVLCGLYTGNKEPFGNYKTPNIDGKAYTPSKFYTYPPTEWEKVNSLYSPIICRPPEHSGLSYTGQCTNVLYPKSPSPFGKGEMTAPCNPSTEAKYYAMRPLLNPHSYNSMLEHLFQHITEKVPSSINQEKLQYQNEFCAGQCYTDVMRYIMLKINQAKNNLNIFKEYAKADTWGGEQFAFVNEQVFMYTNKNYNNLSQQDQAKLARYNNIPGPKKYVVTFTLHNTLRTTSTDIVAILIEDKGQYFLKYIDFATKKPSQWVKGTSISTKAGNSAGINLNNADLPPEQNTPSWIIGNNIENTTFNLKGFHDADESKNILIPGGVPDEFKAVLERCDQASLMRPAGTQGDRFKGGTGSNVTNMEAPVYPMMPNKEEMKWNVFV